MRRRRRSLGVGRPSLPRADVNAVQLRIQPIVLINANQLAPAAVDATTNTHENELRSRRTGVRVLQAWKAQAKLQPGGAHVQLRKRNTQRRRRGCQARAWPRTCAERRVRRHAALRRQARERRHAAMLNLPRVRRTRACHAAELQRRQMP